MGTSRCVLCSFHKDQNRFFPHLDPTLNTTSLVTRSATMLYSSHLNNLGAAAIEVGAFALAMELLKEALDTKLSRISASPNSYNSEWSRHRLDRAQFELIQARKSKSGGDSSDSLMSGHSSASEAFIYRRAFFVEVDEDEDGLRARYEDSVNVSPVCIIQSATLLFNLGLLYHMKAVRRRGSGWTEKSITMYKMALSLVKDVLDSSSGQMVDSRLVLAMLNNLGELYFEQGQYELAKQCFDNLASVLSGMSQSGMTTLVDRNDWTGLVTNSMMLIDPQVAAAA